ncbi:MAG TPA: SAM-dependent methyltransferase [Terriglobia bacterium]
MKDRAVTAPLLPLLLILFIGSGCAALIYEIVWSQLLELVIGASAVSLGVLLATFMGGMCLGSLLFPRLVSARHHPLRLYALLEVGTAAFGLLILFCMPYVGSIYGAIGAFGFWGIVVRATICILCLMPPTLLMGATLPAIARWVQTTPSGIAWLGFFYGGNIAGAVLGCVLAGFYLLRVYDMSIATYVAASINVVIAVAAFLTSKAALYSPPDLDSKQSNSAVPGSWPVYVAIALSGMAALGAEVVWTRLLSMLFGASVYAFSIILAVFLTALGIGSSRASAMSRWSSNPRRDLGICQALLILAIAWSAYMTNSSLPYWPVNPTLTLNFWDNFQMDIFRCALAIGPAALLWGASFPLALAAATARGKDPGRLVGGIYAANTIGGIVGVAAFSLVFVAGYGTQQAQQSLIIISLAAALLALIHENFNKRSLIPAVAAVALGAIFFMTIPVVPGGFIAYGRFFANASYNLRKDKPKVIYSAEGINAAVAVTELRSGIRNFHVAGKIEASTEPRDMKMQRMLGHLPALYNPAPKSILVVGFGAGVTAGAFTLYPGVQRIVICEIEPLIPQAIAGYFRKQNYDVLKDPRVQIVYDDARNFMRTTHEKFDVISYDSIHPWVKGAASLYTEEYFKLAREHLNPGGTISLWVPLYECSMEAAKSQIATFLNVFPDGTLWGNSFEGAGYDLVLMAKKGDPAIDLAQLTDRLARQDHLNVKYSLEDVGIHSVPELAAMYAGRGKDLAPWLADAQINDDRSLRLQYLAGLSLNDYNQDAIYKTILSYNKFPEDLFIGPADIKAELKAALDRAPKS